VVDDPSLFDTNILVDCLKGIEAARQEIDNHTNRAISIITWIEVMVGATAGRESASRALLSTFLVHPISQRVADEAVVIRRENRIKLPDAIILATARIEGRVLISRNTKDFPATMSGVRVPYTT
jgi:predicted nucleic acid-binding protein